jgi:hypothetical protein
MLPRLINRYQPIWFRPFRGPFTLEKRMNEPVHSPEPMVEIRSEIRFAVLATTRNNSRGTYVRSWHLADIDAEAEHVRY